MLVVTPMDLASPKPKMGTAIFFPPYGGKQRCRVISMLRKTPARPFIRQKVHMQCSLASAWAKHRRLFQKAIVVHDVKRVGSECCRKRLIDHDRAIKSRFLPIVAADDRPDKPTPDCQEPLHEFGFSDSSVNLSSGRISPLPTCGSSNSHGSLCRSYISSMLDKLNVTDAYSPLASSLKG